MIKLPGVSLVGSGNLATHLAQALFEKGAIIHEVYSRNLKNASRLSQLVDASTKKDLDFSHSAADIILICTPDEVISQISRSIIISPSISLVHTSGTSALGTLREAGSKYGVFYPLQTFSKTHQVNFEGIPIFVEASDDETEKKIKQLASIISPDVREMNSEDRRVLHLAAVFANNFTNHLLTISEALLGRVNLDLDIIKPLVHETVNKAYELGPVAAQTGPAKRNDTSVIAAHEKLLQQQLPGAWKIYNEHSNAIAKLHT